MTLIGTDVQVGESAPDFRALDTDMKTVSLADFAGKVVILSSLGSLDTSVCDKETRTFNERASELGEDAAILTISMDLPFTAARWCGAAGIDRVRTLSDHRDASFGDAYGVLVKETRLLARAVFVVDREGVIRYKRSFPRSPRSRTTTRRSMPRKG